LRGRALARPAPPLEPFSRARARARRREAVPKELQRLQIGGAPENGSKGGRDNGSKGDAAGEGSLVSAAALALTPAQIDALLDRSAPKPRPFVCCAVHVHGR